jgi:hypothetical protein
VKTRKAASSEAASYSRLVGQYQESIYLVAVMAGSSEIGLGMVTMTFARGRIHASTPAMSVGRSFCGISSTSLRANHAAL